MKTRLKIKPDSTWYGLDLYEELPISVVISQEDISDIASSESPFTKTFTIPGTKNNNKVLGNFYSVSGIDFNPLTRIECVVEYAGEIIFEGFLRLNAVMLEGNYVEYEVYILTDISDFISEIGGKSLVDLDLQDLNHENTYDNITTSWAYTGGTSGLFNGQVLYPMIDYGYIYDSNDNPSFEICIGTGNCFSNSSKAVPEEWFKPSIQLKSLVDRIFSGTSYTYQSDFFNSDYFKKIYMTLSNTDEIGITTEDQDTENRNKFKIYASSRLSYGYDPDDLRAPLVFNTLEPDGYDYLSSYTLDNDFPGFSTDDYLNYFNVPVSGDYYFNLRFGYANQTGGGFPAYFRIKAYKHTEPYNIDNGTLFYQTPGTGYAAIGTRQDANVFFSGALQSDEYVSLYMEFIDTAGSPYSGVYIYGYKSENWCRLDLYESPSLIGTGEVAMKLQMPDMTQEEFLGSLIKMFNLVIVKDDEQRSLRIEPWNTYYNEADRTVRDWSDKIDRNSTIRVEPLDFTLSKDIEWTYSSAGDEVLGKYYEDNFDNIFGNKKYISPSNILKGSQKLELPYRPLPSNTIPGSDYVIIPRTHKVKDDGTKVPTSGEPHIFFWSGNRYVYTGQTGTGQSSWYMSSGGTQVEWNTYPVANHLSNLLNTGTTSISDLNFTPKWDFFQSNNTNVTANSAFALYQTFWKDYIESIYSIEARRLKGRFYLEPQDIGQLKLNDKIFVKDQNWRIEKITDADLTKPKLVEVTLIKELGGYYDENPPAPTYQVSPNASYPLPSTNTLYWYFENLLGSYAGNITLPELTITQQLTGYVLVSQTAFGNGTVGFYSGYLDTVAGFTYRNNLGSINNLQITFGTSSGDDSYGKLQIPQPSDNTYYELSESIYLPSSGNIYVTIDTY